MCNFDQNLEDEVFNLLYSFLPKENFSGSFENLRPIFTPFDQHFLKQKIELITIAGTNGKGETALHLKTLLEERNKNVAVFTSPHIISIRERFLFLGSMISYVDLIEAISECRAQLGGQALSFYEFLFYVFCYQCKKLDSLIDCIILEVGLGGRKDTVNLLTPTITALTSISRDHQEILGKTYKLILKEKLGITRKNTPLISNLCSKYLRNLCAQICLSKGVQYFELESYDLQYNKDSYTERNQIHAKCLNHYLIHQNEKWEESLKKEIIFPTLKGRFEMMTMGEIRFIFIGAHNIDGMRLLGGALDAESKNRKIKLPIDEFWLSFSKRDSKDILAGLKIFKKYTKYYRKLWLTSFSHPKAWDLKKENRQELGPYLPEQMQWKEKLKIMDRDVKKSIAITGSYYFIGEVQKEILLLR